MDGENIFADMILHTAARTSCTLYRAVPANPAPDYNIEWIHISPYTFSLKLREGAEIGEVILLDATGNEPIGNVQSGTEQLNDGGIYYQATYPFGLNTTLTSLMIDGYLFNLEKN
jgi:hypothetical protein